jgi:trans-aconitate methyltransferase
MSQTTSWDPEQYAKNARFVADLGAPLLEILAPKSGEVILDLGCGDGALTERIVLFRCRVVGIDASFAQISAARNRGLEVLVMDGHNLCFRNKFDAVFTNAALHWMKLPTAVVSGVWNALKPGGRFVGEFGGKGNVGKIRSALHAAVRTRGIDPAAIDPWYYPSAEEYSAILRAAGFTVHSAKLVPRPTQLPGDISGWLETFAQPFLNAAGERERPAFLHEVVRQLEPMLRDSQGNWFADYVRLRFAATKAVE